MAKKPPISDQLRKAILASDKSCYRIHKETGIAPSVLSRFLNHQHGLSLASIDKLCESIGARLVVDGNPAKTKPTKRTAAKAKTTRTKGR